MRRGGERVARPIAVWLVAAMFGLAACSGDGSAEPPSSSPGPSSTSMSTTATSSTTATTLPAATTTSAQQALDAEKAKVEAAYRATYAVFTNALTVLEAYDPASVQAVFAPGPLLDEELQFISDFRGQGRRVRRNNPDTTRNTVESVSLSGSDSTTASIIVCESNNAVVYEPGTSPGPEDDV